MCWHYCHCLGVVGVLELVANVGLGFGLGGVCGEVGDLLWLWLWLLLLLVLCSHCCVLGRGCEKREFLKKERKRQKEKKGKKKKDKKTKRKKEKKEKKEKKKNNKKQIPEHKSFGHYKKNKSPFEIELGVELVFERLVVVVVGKGHYNIERSTVGQGFVPKQKSRRKMGEKGTGKEKERKREREKKEREKERKKERKKEREKERKDCTLEVSGC